MPPRSTPPGWSRSPRSGVTSGASVPEILVRDVLAWLAERGYAEVETVVAARESLLFALPHGLRRDLPPEDAAEQDRHDAADAALH